MPIRINGNGTITGLSVGGLRDGTVDSDTLASGLATQGIQMMDTWRISNNEVMEGSNGTITGTWEQVDDSTTTTIGSSLTQSSGIFSFPTTGKYMILGFFRFMMGTSSDGAANVSLDLTTDNFSSSDRANIITDGNTSTSVTNSHGGLAMFDVTNISTHKFKWTTHSFAGNTRLLGDSGENATYFTVIRLGDT